MLQAIVAENNDVCYVRSEQRMGVSAMRCSYVRCWQAALSQAAQLLRVFESHKSWA